MTGINFRDDRMHGSYQNKQRLSKRKVGMNQEFSVSPNSDIRRRLKKGRNQNYKISLQR